MNIKDYVESSKLPFWIKNHYIFKNANYVSFYKIFPSIGLDNCKEKIIIKNNNGLRYAQELRDDLKYNILYTFKFKDNNFRICLCNQLQFDVVDKKVFSIKLSKDIVYNDKKIFKAGTSAMKVYNTILKEYTTNDPNLLRLEDLTNFKNFSSNNFSSKEMEINFVSTGLDAIWDFATISMRGVVSCQSWVNPQSRGLIGTIVNPFVGLIYISSSEQTIYGPKTFKRCLVRYAINKDTKRPALFLDGIYPSGDITDIRDSFIKFLKSKTSLEVFFATKTNCYYLPSHKYQKYLAEGEETYMDYQIPFKQIECDKNLINRYDFLYSFEKDLYSQANNNIIDAFYNLLRRDITIDYTRQEYYTKIFKTLMDIKKGKKYLEYYNEATQEQKCVFHNAVLNAIKKQIKW